MITFSVGPSYYNRLSRYFDAHCRIGRGLIVRNSVLATSVSVSPARREIKGLSEKSTMEEKASFKNRTSHFCCNHNEQRFFLSCVSEITVLQLFTNQIGANDVNLTPRTEIYPRSCVCSLNIYCALPFSPCMYLFHFGLRAANISCSKRKLKLNV